MDGLVVVPLVLLAATCAAWAIALKLERDRLQKMFDDAWTLAVELGKRVDWEDDRCGW